MGGHGFRHLKAYGAVDGVEVVAVCDKNPAALEKAKAELPGVAVYADWEEMLQEAELDVLRDALDQAHDAAQQRSLRDMLALLDRGPIQALGRG